MRIRSALQGLPPPFVLVAVWVVAGGPGCSESPRIDPKLLRGQVALCPEPTRLDDGRYLVGWVEVSRSDTGELVQALPLAFSEPEAETLAYGVGREDVNFDGYEDIGVLEHGGSKWGYLHFWIYDPRSGRFEWSALSDELRELTPASYDVDLEHRRLVVRHFRGAILETLLYRVCGGSLELLESYRE